MTWQIDKAHTEIEFSARHMMVSTVKGHFREFSGEVAIDPDDLTKSWAKVSIQAATLESREETRDKHLRSADFLDVNKFPEVTYRSTKVESAGGSHYRVEGDLTIRDVTRPIELDVEFLGISKSPYGIRAVGFEANGSFNRKDFGLVWNMGLETGGFLVGDEVKIHIDAEVDEVADDAGSAA